MKKIISILFATLAILLFSNFVLATSSISITSVSIPSSVTQGDTFTITMSVSGSEVTGVSGSLTLPSQITCSPSTSQTISLGSGGTGSATWTFCSASVAGDYSNRITASVTATSSTGGSVSDSKQTGLTVLSPASLTASSTLSSSSVTAGSSVTFTVGVNNVGDSSTTYSISLSCPTGLSCSPSSVSSTAISGNSLANNQFTVTGGTAGSYTLTATVSSPVQADLTTSKSLTVTTATTTTTAAAGGSTGSTVVETGKITKTFTSITVLTPKTIAESQLVDSKTKLTEVYIAVATRVTDVSITIEKLAGRPTDATEAPNAYEYIKITTKNLVNISQAKMKFKTEKSWASNNKIDVSTIALYRYTTSWNKLKTAKLSEDSTYYYFEAETPDFSYFAIGGEKLARATTTTTAVTTKTTTVITTTTTVPLPPVVPKISTTYITIIVVIVVFVVLLIIF
ncbi:MAG: PGF-pre-PGF domain-containing protein, partial [Thaumarchaeota archaeon]|nr:PGF-pre-PGF domain-containing protein [Nitrososphaerota archaeon]